MTDRETLDHWFGTDEYPDADDWRPKTGEAETDGAAPSGEPASPVTLERREKIPERCGEAHPTDEMLSRIEGDEYVYARYTCYYTKGHDGPHAYITATGGWLVEWN